MAKPKPGKKKVKKLTGKKLSRKSLPTERFLIDPAKFGSKLQNKSRINRRSEITSSKCKK